MLGAIYVGLSGMDAYSKGLQSISNNVANLNSPGFKATAVTFSDVYSQGGQGLTYTRGGDDQPGGNGVKVATSAIDFSQGSLQQSGGDLDLAIQGGGFLVLQDGTGTAYARTGQFAVGNDGYITLQGGKFHLSVLNAANQAEALNIDSKRTSKPTATTTITFADNLSSTATSDTVSNIKVSDSAGGQHTWQVAFTATGASAPGQWQVAVTDDSGVTVGSGTLKFIGGTVDPSTAKITVTSAPTGADPLSVVLDFSTNVSNFSSGTTSTLRAASVDGNPAGALTGVTVDSNGHVQLAYSNSKTADLGAVALADFRDPQQLTRVAGGLFENHSVTQTRLLASGAQGIGTLVSKQIEASNVNLSQEFGELILVQRGFQASSQVVSVANDMIQNLFGIRGQG